MDKGLLNAKFPHGEHLDASLQLAAARLTGGISPAAVLLAYTDWYLHLLTHPSKQMELAELAQENFWHLMHQFSLHLIGECRGEYCALTSPEDKRFTGEAWQQFPYTFYYESFLLLQDWWNQATTDIFGVSKHHADVVDFSLRQMLDIFSPANSVLFNPEVQQAAVKTQGKNFLNGFENLLDDIRRYQLDLPPPGAENFVIGKDVAITPGNIIFRNDLIELIQYSPQTDHVYAEPILITPAWIMKYYILDLTPRHSLVNYLVKNGHTVYMISWKNPQKQDADKGMQDYLDLGILSALNSISKIHPTVKTHLVGYCLGGTLTAIATAALARDKIDLLASMTLFAAQTDFTEPGELDLFIDESQISFLEAMMKEHGYLDTHQMAGAFQLLRSNDLIWSKMVHDYMLGQRKPLNDLMAWNADATRLPYKMHSQYLRRLFLNNELAEGKYIVNDKPIALRDIKIPVFVVATERDHVSPWKSVFKINLLTTCDVTFLLTSGGHNVGIVSPPGKKIKYYYRVSTLTGDDSYIDPDTWHKQTKEHPGSWWPAFDKWLANHSSGKVKPPAPGKSLCKAPGKYVLEK